MGDGGGYEVLTGELDGHAGKVDALVERLRTAGDAASEVTMNDSAYGVVCQPFARMLQPFEELGVRTLRQGAQALTDVAKKVRDTARSYGTVESDEERTFRGYEREL